MTGADADDECKLIGAGARTDCPCQASPSQLARAEWRAATDPQRLGVEEDQRPGRKVAALHLVAIQRPVHQDETVLCPSLVPLAVHCEVENVGFRCSVDARQGASGSVASSHLTAASPARAARWSRAASSHRRRSLAAWARHTVAERSSCIGAWRRCRRGGTTRSRPGRSFLAVRAVRRRRPASLKDLGPVEDGCGGDYWPEPDRAVRDLYPRLDPTVSSLFIRSAAMQLPVVRCRRARVCTHC